MLSRAIWTLWHCLDGMERTWLPVKHHWRLNERHYGALQGLNKTDMAKQYGDEQVRSGAAATTRRRPHWKPRTPAPSAATAATPAWTCR